MPILLSVERVGIGIKATRAMIIGSKVESEIFPRFENKIYMFSTYHTQIWANQFCIICKPQTLSSCTH